MTADSNSTAQMIPNSSIPVLPDNINALKVCIESMFY